MKNVLIIVVIFFVTACNNKSSIHFKDELIMKMASEDMNLPSQYGSFYLYAKCNDGKLVRTDIHELRVLYKDINDMKFDEFLRGVLNQQSTLNLSNVQDCFVLDDSITNEYNKANFESFKDIFFEKKESQRFVLKKDVKAEKMNTIFYYCFLNNYLVSFDDYIGYYYLNKV